MNVALAALAGVLGLGLILCAAPMWMLEVRRLVKEQTWTPIRMFAPAFVFALGIALLGVTIWLSLTL